MQRAALVALLPACGAALSAKPHAHFMVLAQTKEQCSDDAYTGPTAEEYRKMCADIDADCKSGADNINAAHEANLKALSDECERQKRILAGKEDVHADEKSDRKEEDMDVAEAKKAVAEKSHCRPELIAAKEHLAEEEAIPNDSHADIDNECKAKKRVMEAEQCVAQLEAAEAVLAKQKGEHAEESSEEKQAASALPPQEEKVRIACAAYDAAKANGPPTGGLDKLNQRCQDKRDDLLRQADEAIESLLAEYLRQKAILEGKEDVHADEKADVAAQAKVVAAERKDVQEAKIVVERDAHCPPELEKAKAALAKQEAIPNDTPTDIDEECEAKKAVMEAEACVERLRKAEKVLGTQKDQHVSTKADLHVEAREEDSAAAALPPQQKIVCDLKAALDAARNARKAFPCGSEEEKPEPAPAPAPAPAPEPEQEKKSGTVRSTAALALVAGLLCGLVQA